MGLQFEIDAQNRLTVKDIANRAVLVGIAGNKGITESMQQTWQQGVDSAMAKIVDAEHSIMKSRSQFHGALPHNFINDSFPALIEQSISDAADKVTELKGLVEKSAFRISHLSEYFAK
ncbi:ATPase RavA domain-containing protein [Photobacterium leiognathi subsp. mandapamensis]